jgi:hypothetical protein
MAVVSQMAFSAVAVTLWSIGQLSDDEKEKEYWGEMYKALPDYYKRNYMVIRNPSHSVGDDITNAFIRVPLPFGAKEMYATIIDSDMGEYMDNKITSIESIAEYVTSSFDILGLGEVSVPPLVSAIAKFKYNKDLFNNSKVVYDESTGEYSFLEEKQGTLPIIQAAAEKTKAFSAPRLQAAIESYTGKFDRNPFTQVITNSLNSIYEAAAGKENSIIKSIKDDPNKLIESPLSSVTSKFYVTPVKYYQNKFVGILSDYIYSKLNSDFNPTLVSKANERMKELGLAGMASNDQLEFFVKDAEKFLKDVEKDLGKKEALKYEKKLREARIGEIKDVLKLNIIEDDSLRKLSKERSPFIKGRAAYDILKGLDNEQNKKFLVATALKVTEDWNTLQMKDGYIERGLEDMFGSEYREKFKNTLKGSRSTAIDDMYRASKEFNTDSKEVKDKKLGFINLMKFYIDSRNPDASGIKGDNITDSLFGFYYPRK